MKWVAEATLYLDKARGKLGLIGIIPAKVKGSWIASQSFYILRVEAGAYDPLVLYMYLKSPQAQELLMSQYYGGQSVNIKLSDSKAFPVPIYSAKKQEEIRKNFYRILELETQMGEIRKEISSLYGKTV